MDLSWAVWGAGAVVLALHACMAWALQQISVKPLVVAAQPALAVSWVNLPTPTVASAAATPAVAQQRAALPALQPARPAATRTNARTTATTEQPTALQTPQEGLSSSAVPELPAATTPDMSPVTTPVPPTVTPPKLIPPSMIRYIEPPTLTYPTASRRLGESGTVVVRVYVDEAGLPRWVQVAQSSGYVRLDEAAVAAVQQTRFVPYMENGQATAGWARIPFPFELERSR